MYCVRSVGVNYTRITYLDIYGARYAVREYKSYRLEGFMAIRHEDKLETAIRTVMGLANKEEPRRA